MDTVNLSQSTAHSKTKIKELENQLCDLAATYRHYGSVKNTEQREATIVRYQATIKELESLGWTGSLDYECELPYEFMPESYLERIGYGKSKKGGK